MTNGSGSGTQHDAWDERREQLSAYLDGELAGAERAHLDAHLATCAECQRELAELRQVRALLRALPAPALPRSFTLPVEATAAPISAPTARRHSTAARTTRGAGRWARATQWTGGLAASIGLLLLLGSALTSGGIHSFGGASSGSASQPYSPQSNTTTGAPAGASGAATHAPQTGVQDHATPSQPALSPSATTPAPTATTRSPENSQFSGESGASSPSASAIVGVTGAGLAGGGALLFIGGTVARRRKRNR